MKITSFVITRIVLIALLLAVFVPNWTAAIDCGKNASHNIFMGQRLYGDELIFMDHPHKSAKWLRTVSTDSNSGSLRLNINYIEVIDANTDGNGGCAFLTAGGLDTNNVAFHLKSQRSEGIDFTIKVFGR